MKAFLVAVALVMASVPAMALDNPKPGPYDHRIKFVDYNALDVVKLVAHYGYQINIVLAEDEAIVPGGVFMGDNDAWKFGTHRNLVVLKPAATLADTNLTFMTSKGRTYNFILSAHINKKGPDTDDMMFQVNYRYPQDEAAKAALLAKLDEEEKKMETARNLKTAPTNWNYMAQGSELFTPDAAYDNGTFTYLTFAGNREIPAVFVVNEDGSESLVNRHMEGNTIVIHRTAAKFVMRKGNSVTCVFNDSYNVKGGPEILDGSTLPGIKRITKGDQ